MDHFGKIWKFNKEMGKNIKREIFLNKYGFGLTAKKSSGFNLLCRKKVPNGICKFAGIYLNSNGCFYSRGKHNHEQIEKVGIIFYFIFGVSSSFIRIQFSKIDDKLIFILLVFLIKLVIFCLNWDLFLC